MNTNERTVLLTFDSGPRPPS